MLRFTVKPGNHYSGNWFRKMLNCFWRNEKRFSYNVIFDKNCEYDLHSVDQEDINKLYGVCFGYLPHKDSMRFGWNYSKELNKINLYTYCYLNEKRECSFLCSVNMEKEYTLNIHILSKGKALFTVICNETDKIAQKITPINKTTKWGIRLWPYFGGTTVAPHEITVSLKEH